MTTDYDRLLALVTTADGFIGDTGHADTVRHLVARAQAADAAEAEVQRLRGNLALMAESIEAAAVRERAAYAEVSAALDSEGDEEERRIAAEAERDDLRRDVERLTALNDATYRDHLVQMQRIAAERDALRARLDALTSPEAVEAVAQALFTAPKLEGEQTYYPTLAAAAVRALADYAGEVTR